MCYGNLDNKNTVFNIKRYIVDEFKTSLVILRLNFVYRIASWLQICRLRTKLSSQIYFTF